MALKPFIRRQLTGGCLFICALAVASPLLSAPLTWTVNGTFSNGGTLNGTFDYDATTSMASNWNLNALGYNYTPSDSTFTSGQCCTDQFDFIFTVQTILTLDFAFNPDLTNAGGTSNIAGGGVVAYPNGPDQPPTTATLVSGSATTGTVGPPPPPPPPPATAPEPGTSWLLFAGFIISGVALLSNRTVSRHRASV